MSGRQLPRGLCSRLCRAGYSCALILWLSPELGLCLCYLILVFLGQLLVLVGYITQPWIPVKRWRSAFGLGEHSLHTLLWTGLLQLGLSPTPGAQLPFQSLPPPYPGDSLSLALLRWSSCFLHPMSSSYLFLLITFWWRHSPVAFGDRMLGGKMLETKCMIETVIDSLYSFSFHFLPFPPTSFLSPSCSPLTWVGDLESSLFRADRDALHLVLYSWAGCLRPKTLPFPGNDPPASVRGRSVTWRPGVSPSCSSSPSSVCRVLPG